MDDFETRILAAARALVARDGAAGTDYLRRAVAVAQGDEVPTVLESSPGIVDDLHRRPGRPDAAFRLH